MLAGIKKVLLFNLTNHYFFHIIDPSIIDGSI